MKNIPSSWQAINDGTSWQVLDERGRLIATLSDIPDAETKAKQIAISPYILSALTSMVELLGYEDMPDNGELSGAAISDMARVAVEMSSELSR
ncbi:hypothetical protein ACFLXH_00980 [Chloroflexota bacterium]